MSRPLPALVTGTSSEYLGNRPLRRILRERPVVVVTGPARSGKSTVAMKIASWQGSSYELLDSSQTYAEAVKSVRHARWVEAVKRTPVLILDGPENLRNCRGVCNALLKLIDGRRKAGLRTIIVEAREDGSADALMASMPAGSAALLALRMPGGRPGRRRWAARMCDDLALSRELAQGTEDWEPWGYERVLEWLREQVPRLAQA